MRRAELKIIYEDVDISRDISFYLTAFSYSDEAHGRQNNVTIILADPDGRWSGPWYPQKGAALRVGLELYNWQHDGDRFSLDFGIFEIDEITVRGKPQAFEIKAVAVPV